MSPDLIDRVDESESDQSSHISRATRRRPKRLPQLTLTVLALALLIGVPANPTKTEEAGQLSHASLFTAEELAPAQDTGLFTTEGDYVHISSTPPRAASAHGWWTVDANVGEPPELAIVTVQLQIKSDDGWIDVGVPGSERVKPGGGSANRANARVECVSATTSLWRSVIDVDLVGFADSANKKITAERSVQCSV